jgi:RsmE family RNA methyltransferase
MNLVLFENDELGAPLSLSDDRARHILRVLRRGTGDEFDVGLVHGPRGKAVVNDITNDHLSLSFTWSEPHPPPPPTALGIGLPRPQTARDVLRDATTLGASELHFLSTERADPNYRQSSLWTKSEWHRHLKTGAAQAFDTHLPKVSWQQSLDELLSRADEPGAIVIALDVYTGQQHLGELILPSPRHPVLILIGPERGWAEQDFASFVRHRVQRYHLGSRVHRTENAVVAGLTLVNAARARAVATVLD